MTSKEIWEKGTDKRPAKCALFAVEIIFFVHFDNAGNIINRTDRWFIYNQAWDEIRTLRETLFTHGFFLERSPGRGEIVFPMDFRKILIDIQKSGWKETV